MTDEPPSLPAEKTNSSDAFAFQAAKLSAALPFVAFAISAGLNAAFVNHEPVQRAKLTLMVGGITALVVVIGLFLALFALVCIPKHGARGILLPALVGLVIPSLLAAIAIPNFIKAREQAIENRKQTESVVAARDEMLLELREGFNEEDGLASTAEVQRKYQARLAAAAENMSGEQGIALRATAEFSRKQQLRVSEFERTSMAFVEAGLLDLSTITNRAQLGERKIAATTYLGEATSMKAFVAAIPTHMRTELDQTTLSDKMKNEFIKLFLSRAQANIDIGLQVRDQDIRIANAMTQLFDFLEQSWGNWRSDPADGATTFETGAALAKFNAFHAEINDAAAEQVRLQKALLQPKQN
jgi:hypothetical protein